MQHLQSNTTLQGGKYRIEDKLGQGGFGITYLATQISLNRKVAIKELFIGGSGQAINERRGNMVVVTNSANQASFDQQKEKFKKEAERLANLNHPNLVKVHELFEENGTAYYVMDYIDGESLRTKVNREGALPEDLVLNYLQQLLPALEVAHKKSIWHLDIKPENIMVDKHGHVYLIDFGASKHIEQNNTLTTSLVLAYTKGYCPPELTDLIYESQEDLIDALKEIGPWTDFYALGATIYNLLTDNIPPSSKRIEKNGSNAFTFPSNISSSTQDLIVWMMEPDRGDRPQEVCDVQSEIEHEDDEETKCMFPNDNIDSDEESVVTSDSSSTTNEDYGRGYGIFAYCFMTLMTLCFFVIEMIDNYWLDWWANIIFGILLISSNVALYRIIKEIKQKRSLVLFVIFDILVISVIPSVYLYNEWKKQKILDNIINNMIYVEGGTFTMGHNIKNMKPSDFDYPSYSPPHNVTLSSFYIGKYEVTQEEWECVMGNNPSSFHQSHNIGKQYPVETITWNEAKQFAEKLSSMTGIDFRLPTEAEWEYAARGGRKSDGYLYSGSNNLYEVAWFHKDPKLYYRIHEVGKKKPNELGLYDMSGNVSEYCQDYWYEYSASSQKDPLKSSYDPKLEMIAILCRGGNVEDEELEHRVYARDSRWTDSGEYQTSCVGLRLACTNIKK